MNEKDALIESLGFDPGWAYWEWREKIKLNAQVNYLLFWAQKIFPQEFEHWRKHNATRL